MPTYMLNNCSCCGQTKAPRKSEAGFTLLEAVVAMVLLLIASLGLAAVFSYSMAANNISRNVTRSKQIIAGMGEQIETLRNTGQLTFGQIANQGAANFDATGALYPFAGFPSGFLPVKSDPGPDGIYGTDDDVDDLIDPSRNVKGYSRRILITSLNPYLKRVETTLQYPGNGGTTQQLVGITYLNNDARGTFRR